LRYQTSENDNRRRRQGYRNSSPIQQVAKTENQKKVRFECAESKFQHWARLSGLAIPFQGPYCLRHSYAVRLLRLGVSVKTIGDLLGHRVTESTEVYLRLSLEDLREVALPLPKDVSDE
jgi:site-specific recombinase XerD